MTLKVVHSHHCQLQDFLRCLYSTASSCSEKTDSIFSNVDQMKAYPKVKIHIYKKFFVQKKIVQKSFLYKKFLTKTFVKGGAFSSLPVAGLPALPVLMRTITKIAIAIATSKPSRS